MTPGADFLERVNGTFAFRVNGPAAFALDAYDPRVRKTLALALKAVTPLTASARAELLVIAKIADPLELGSALVKWVARRRLLLADLLGAASMAALLEGAAEVAARLPPLPPPHSTPPPPPTLSPAEAAKLVDGLRRQPEPLRRHRIAGLPADQQSYVLSALRSPPPPPGEPLDLTPPEAGSPEESFFPVLEAAARDLAGKNVLDRGSQRRLDAQVRAKAEDVAEADARETLVRVRDLLAENVRRGADLASFHESLRTLPGPTFLSQAHAEVLFRTAVQAAFSDGQAHVLRHPFVRSGFPYAAYDAIDDDRVRHDHLSMETLGIGGTNVYRIEDPVFLLFRPPWAWQCRCAWWPMTVRQAAEKGIEEAREWLRAGVEPYPPAFVDMPPFRPDESFRRFVEAAPLSIRLSLGPLGDDDADAEAEFAWTVYGKSASGVNRWKDAATGRVVYQENMPGQRGTGKEPGTPRGPRRTYEESPWQEYEGRGGARKGQKGWKNAQTGRVVWGEEMPTYAKTPKYTPEQAAGRVKVLPPLPPDKEGVDY